MGVKPTYDDLVEKVKELEEETLRRKSAEEAHLSARDVTLRKHTEKALQESEARYRGIFEYTMNGVAVYRALDDGRDFIFVDFNRSGEKIDNIKKNEIIGRSVLDVFPGVIKFGLLEVFRRVWESGRPEHHPVSLYQDDRIIGWRDNFVYRLPSGEIVAVYSDETDIKQSEEALRKAHEELYNFSQKLEEMVRVRTKELEEKTRQLIVAERHAATWKIANRVAHELRNPLTVVGGFTRRLNDRTPDNNPDKRYHEIILREVKILEEKVSKIIKLEDEEQEVET